MKSVTYITFYDNPQLHFNFEGIMLLDRWTFCKTWRLDINQWVWASYVVSLTSMLTCRTVKSYWTWYLVFCTRSQRTVISCSTIPLGTAEAFIKTKASWRTLCTSCLVPETRAIIISSTGTLFRNVSPCWAVLSWRTHNLLFCYGASFTVITLLTKPWLVCQSWSLAEISRRAWSALTTVAQTCRKGNKRINELAVIKCQIHHCHYSLYYSPQSVEYSLS